MESHSFIDLKFQPEEGFSSPHNKSKYRANVDPASKRRTNPHHLAASTIRAEGRGVYILLCGALLATPGAVGSSLFLQLREKRPE